MTITPKFKYKIGTNSGTWQYLNREQLLASQKWNYLDKEFAKRVISFLDMTSVCQREVGIGTVYRSYNDQVREFRKRYRGVNSKLRDSIYWDGTDSSGTAYKYWVKKDIGIASMAPPGATYHDLVTNEKKCLAIDLMALEKDRRFLRDAASQWGLYMSSDPTDPHHFQPLEIPLSKKNYNPNIHKLSNFSVPKNLVYTDDPLKMQI